MVLAWIPTALSLLFFLGLTWQKGESSKGIYVRFVGFPTGNIRGVIFFPILFPSILSRSPHTHPRTDGQTQEAFYLCQSNFRAELKPKTSLEKNCWRLSSFLPSTKNPSTPDTSIFPERRFSTHLPISTHRECVRESEWEPSRRWKMEAEFSDSWMLYACIPSHCIQSCPPAGVSKFKNSRQ